VKKILVAAALFSSTVLAWTQDSSLVPNVAWVQHVPGPLATLSRGKPGKVDVVFSVHPGYHINSNTPHSDYLIPTVLKLDPPTDIAVAKVIYPRGEDMSFAFDPSTTLNVYTRQFVVAVQVHPLATVVPGKYMVRGDLKYQACDDRACYPPKHLPVSFEVQVKRAPAARRRNPRQSPNVHQ
jgi:hypothetical protein